MKADRFVLDSNVLISAALCATGAPAALVKALRRTSATLIFSKETHAELHDRLMKSKFDASLHFTQKAVSDSTEPCFIIRFHFKQAHGMSRQR